jgi:hypothetical protein
LRGGGLLQRVNLRDGGGYGCRTGGRARRGALFLSICISGGWVRRRRRGTGARVGRGDGRCREGS